MRCQKCKKDFEEKDIQESHDVPCYLFEGNRKGRKNQADKFGRHLLCEECHKKYELELSNYLRIHSRSFAMLYFKEGENGDFI